MRLGSTSRLQPLTLQWLVLAVLEAAGDCAAMPTRHGKSTGSDGCTDKNLHKEKSTDGERDDKKPRVADAHVKG